MANLLNIQSSIAFATPLLKNQPLLVSGMEPAITAANMILQTMLGPPFVWRWNRSNTSIAITNNGGTDYVKALGDLGFLEAQWLTDGATPPAIFELNGAVVLAKDGNSARPTRIAPQYDDNQGNITFRFDKVPDKAYTAFLDYQRKASLITSPAQSWGPVSDEFSYIYDYGFLTLAALLINDSRFPIYEQYFIARLLGAQDGLSDQQRDIFVGNWMRKAQTITRDQASVSMGGAGRGK